MADDAKAALEGLIKSINDKIQGTDSVLQAVHKQLAGNVDTATGVTQELIKNNTTPKSAFEETQKLHKAAVENTLKAMAAVTPQTKDGGKGGS